jgi:hypothetical protein
MRGALDKVIAASQRALATPGAGLAESSDSVA